MTKFSLAVVVSLVTANAFATNWPLYRRVHCASGNDADVRISESVNVEVARVRQQNPAYSWNPKVSVPVVTALPGGSPYVCVTVVIE